MKQGLLPHAQHVPVVSIRLPKAPFRRQLALIVFLAATVVRLVWSLLIVLVHALQATRQRTDQLHVQCVLQVSSTVQKGQQVVLIVRLEHISQHLVNQAAYIVLRAITVLPRVQHIQIRVRAALLVLLGLQPLLQALRAARTVLQVITPTLTTVLTTPVSYARRVNTKIPQVPSAACRVLLGSST
jgi:hypothetical protein